MNGAGAAGALVVATDVLVLRRRRRCRRWCWRPGDVLVLSSSSSSSSRRDHRPCWRRDGAGVVVVVIVVVDGVGDRGAGAVVVVIVAVIVDGVGDRGAGAVSSRDAGIDGRRARSRSGRRDAKCSSPRPRPSSTRTAARRGAGRRSACSISPESWLAAAKPAAPSANPATAAATTATRFPIRPLIRAANIPTSRCVYVAMDTTHDAARLGRSVDSLGHLAVLEPDLDPRVGGAAEPDPDRVPPRCPRSRPSRRRPGSPRRATTPSRSSCTVIEPPDES